MLLIIRQRRFGECPDHVAGAGGTNFAPSSFVTRPAKSRIADFAAPSFQDGSGPLLMASPLSVRRFQITAGSPAAEDPGVSTIDATFPHKTETIGQIVLAQERRDGIVSMG
jgi:hypothetical protein